MDFLEVISAIAALSAVALAVLCHKRPESLREEIRTYSCIQITFRGLRLYFFSAALRVMIIFYQSMLHQTKIILVLTRQSGAC